MSRAQDSGDKGQGRDDKQGPKALEPPALQFSSISKTPHFSAVITLGTPIVLLASTQKMKCPLLHCQKTQERDRVGMWGGGAGGDWCPLPSHQNKNDLRGKLFSLFPSRNWVRYSSREKDLFSPPAVI